MKNVVAMLLAVALATVAGAQVWTNAPPPVTPPGWTNGAAPPPAWFDALTYTGDVAGVRTNLQLMPSVVGWPELTAELRAAVSNGGGTSVVGSVAFADVTGSVWANDSASNALAARPTGAAVTGAITLALSGYSPGTAYGSTTGTAYRGDWGANVSSRVASVEANTSAWNLAASAFDQTKQGHIHSDGTNVYFYGEDGATLKLRVGTDSAAYDRWDFYNPAYFHGGIFDADEVSLLNGTNILAHSISSNAIDAATDAAYRAGGGSLTNVYAYNTNAMAGVVTVISSNVLAIGTNDADAITHDGTVLMNLNGNGLAITNIERVVFNAAAWTNYTSIYATRTNLVLVPPSVATSLQMQVERRDTLNEYDMTNGFFYPKNAGRYRVDYQHIWPIIPNGFPYTEQITVDGVPYVNRLSVYDASAPNYSDTISFGATVACTDTSVVKVFIAQYNATGVSNGQANVSGGYVFINIERVLP